MALKLLICLLFVVGATSNPPQPIESFEYIMEISSTNSTNSSTTATPATPATPATSAISATPATPATPSSTNSTAPSNSSAPTEPPKPTEPAPTEPGVCASNPCGGGSTCQERANKTYVCLCLAGDYYDCSLGQCVLGKVFPGTITHDGVYEEDMEDPTSEIFAKTVENIVKALDIKFTEKYKAMYRGSNVTKLSKPTEPTKVAGGIIATVEIKFDKTSTVTSENVKETAGVSFRPINLCESNPCDITANCTENEGTFTCKCMDKYVSTEFSDRLCVACPKNEKAVDNSCKPCGFGYSGFNCEDNWQLILVIVGSVLGGLLLVTIILLPVVAVTTKKKSKGKATDYEKPRPNPAPAKTPQVSNGSALPRPAPVQPTPAGGRPGYGGNAVPRIPRATTNESWERSNLEMVPSNSRQNLIPAGRNSRRFDDHDDPYSRPIKPQNNPYAMGRPQVNPYASSQGNSNPYFRNDEARRF